MSRSYLFIPGDVPRMLQNLEVFDADSVIIDFEDAVGDNQKDEARHLTKAFLTRHHFERPELWIRINAHTERHHFDADLRTIKTLDIKGIVLPKTSLEALRVLSECFEVLSLNFPVIGLIETPRAFFELEAIASHPRVTALLLGGEDLTKAIGAVRTNQGDEILYARSCLVFAAKSFGKTAIDTPFTRINDLEQLAHDANKAAKLGFDAKAAIHPNHVDTIHQSFTPTEDALREAKRIVTKSEREQSTRFSLDGKMIDKPIIERARQLLARAEKYNKRG